MKLAFGFAAVLMAVAMAAPVVRGADGDNKPAAQGDRQRGPADGAGDRFGGMGPRPFAGQYEAMERTLELTEEQKPKVKEAVEAAAKETEESRKAAMDKLSETMAKARTEDGQDARRQMREEMKQANDELTKVIAGQQEKISALLTAEQKATWEGFKLGRSLQGRFAQVDLNDDQRAKIKELAEAAGKEIAEAKDAAAAATVTGKLVKKVVAEILTDEQTAKLVSGAPLMMGMPGMGGGQGGNGAPRGNLP